MGQPELVMRSSRKVKRVRSLLSLRIVEPMGQRESGMPTVSVRHLLVDDDAPCVGIPSLGMGCLVRRRRAPQWVGFRLGRREGNTQTPQPGWERSAVKRSIPVARLRERSTPITGRVSSDERDQPQPLNNARQPEELRQTPTAGLDRGRRDSSTPPVPVRAACGELRRIRSGSIPSWGLSGERIILTVRPGHQGSRPQDFYG